MLVADALNTGVALQNLAQESRFPFDPVEQTVTLQLLDSAGVILAQASITLPARGQTAVFVTELNWNPAVDFTDFAGTIEATGNGDFAALMLLQTGDELATLPVTRQP